MADAMFLHQLGTLRPADDSARELLHGLKNGEAVKVTLRRPRNVRFHRLFWALMSKVHENLPEDKAERYPTVENLVAWFKVATGHRDTFTLDNGHVVYIPKSISFAKMDNAEFSAFFDRCADLIAKHFIPNVSRADWRREIEEMIGVAA